MSERHAGKGVGEGTSDLGEVVGRRGALAWAATLAGAGLAWLGGGARRAEATHLVTGTAGADRAALHVDHVNPGTLRTFLVGDSGSMPPMVVYNGTGPFSWSGGDAFQGMTERNNGAGVHGHGRAASGSGAGVFGDTTSLAGTGVMGSCGTAPFSPPSGVGVYGISRAESGIGVRGQIPSGVATANTIAVYAENFSSNPGPLPGAGGFGCYGYSAQGHGLVGATGAVGAGALIGSTNGVAGAYAGIFYGPMVVVGGPKSAAVPHADGTHRLLYCVESTESWFEDFGKSTLVRGCATVPIDPEFGAVADMSDYHVFLTPYGKSKALYVASQTPTAFTVEAHDDGSAEIGFSWRVVAKRKDIAGKRLAKVAIPKEPPHPTAPTTVHGPALAIVPAPNKPKRFYVQHGANEPKHSHK
jgi:hypothetical protein